VAGAFDGISAQIGVLLHLVRREELRRFQMVFQVHVSQFGQGHADPRGLPSWFQTAFRIRFFCVGNNAGLWDFAGMDRSPSGSDGFRAPSRAPLPGVDGK
jgi:hypothetical protein